EDRSERPEPRYPQGRDLRPARPERVRQDDNHQLLLGLLFPTSGDALVFGESALTVNKNERIGYLPEESYLYRFLNAEETLDFYGRLFNLTPDVRHKRAGELIEKVGLANDKRRILKEYSKGM